MSGKNRPWTAAEDHLVLTSTLPLRQLGAQLGRTPGAVRVRRVSLKKRRAIQSLQPVSTAPTSTPASGATAAPTTSLVHSLGVRFRGKSATNKAQPVVPRIDVPSRRKPAPDPADSKATAKAAAAAEKAAQAAADRRRMDNIAECRELGDELRELAKQNPQWPSELVARALTALRTHDLITYYQITDQLFAA